MSIVTFYIEPNQSNLSSKPVHFISEGYFDYYNNSIVVKYYSITTFVDDILKMHTQQLESEVGITKKIDSMKILIIKINISIKCIHSKASKM